MAILNKHHERPKRLYTNRDGFVALVSVLVLGAVGLDLAVSLLMLGLDTGRTALTYSQAVQASGLASACADAGLSQLKAAVACEADGNLQVGSGSCDFTAAVAGGYACQLTATGTVQNVVRHVQVNLSQVDPSLTVASWRPINHD